jgi:uncharacterized protein YbjT (DUF2867 family)
VGQGVLRECLLASDVENVLSIGRNSTGQTHAKLREIKHAALTDYTSLTEEMRGYDACFFCLGVSSAGMSEGAYRAITLDIPVAAATALSRINPDMTFVLVTGAGTDDTGTSTTMWARAKGESENRVRALPFKRVVVFRPGFIQPLHGIKSRTKIYNVLYTLLRPLLPLIRAMTPVITTESIGHAMLNVVRHGADKPVLESLDIQAAAQARA